MPKAKPTSTTKPVRPESPCPAAAMARLIGTYFEANINFQTLLGVAEKGSIEAIDLDYAGEVAMRVADIARFALAMTPAHSLEGAIAKIVISWEIDSERFAGNHSLYDENLLHTASNLLKEDAIRCLADDCGIDLDALGVGNYFTTGAMPLAVVERGWQVAREVIAKQAA